MIINGIELEDLNGLDYEIAQKVEKELEKTQGIQAKIANLQNSEGIKVICDAINEIFDNIFGEGTSEKVFKNKRDLLISMKAFEDLCMNYKESQNAINDIFKKYSPNRAARRNK